MCARLIRQSLFYFILPPPFFLSAFSWEQPHKRDGLWAFKILRPRLIIPGALLDRARVRCVSAAASAWAALSQPWQQAGGTAREQATGGLSFAWECGWGPTLLPLYFKGRIIKMTTVPSGGSVFCMEGGNQNNFVFRESSVILRQGH